MGLFEDFTRDRIEVAGCSLNVLTGGEGPPVLLLHGYPQTHVAWHAIAPRLARRHTLVIPDLPGYGDSEGPPADAAHRGYSKRHMGGMLLALMRALGHERFALAGHDRGARIGYRLALDHPGVLSHLAVLDIIPTLEVWEAMRAPQALATYHWPLLAQPAPLPERLVGADPDFYLGHLIDRWKGKGARLDERALHAYAVAFRKPSVIEATCEDYRAGAGVDVDDDRADRDAGRRIACPVLLLRGRQYLPDGSSALAVWQRWAVSVSERVLDCGHFIAEECPDDTAEALEGFFAGRP